MLQIEIDGKEITVEQGKTVMEAAHQIGTYIPHFCYHKKLSIAASCRMCLVEVEKAPKPLPACATPVTDGMKVCTHSPKAKEAQKGVMEFLLINHPLDCPICDQGGECQLQDLSVGYGNGVGRFSEPKNVAVGKDMGPLVSAAEMSRCIHCTRCVRFTEEIAGFQEIGMAHRGEHSEIMPFIGKTVTSEISGNVIDLCPVGALTSKPFRYSARSWELSRRKSISAHDALGSNLIVQVKDHQVKRVLPLENEAINECWLSDRDRFAYEGLNHADRLNTPKIKQDGRWHEVDWQTAFQYIVKGINGVSADFGKEGLGMWVNPSSTIEELYLAKKLAKNLAVDAIDSRLRQQDIRLDKNRTLALWLGQSIEELSQSDAVLVIGADLRSEQPLLTARLRKMAQAGCQISTLGAQKEVLNMPTSHQLAVHPQEWAQSLIQLCDAQQDEYQTLSGSLKDAEKVTILLGAQVQNHPQFAEIYGAAQQLAQACNATLGILPQAANSVGADILHLRPQKNEHSFIEMCRQPKKAVILVNVDPKADTASGFLAEAALKQAQTVIAISAYQSESLLQCADVLLPMTPFSETSGSFINMEGRLQHFHGVVKPLGEARPLWKILRVLGNHLHLEGFDFNTSEEVLSEALPEKDFTAYLDNLQQAPAVSPVSTPTLWRSGSVGLYDSDAIVRRAESLQKTIQAAVPCAKIHPNTLNKLGFSDEESVFAQQKDGTEIKLTLRIDNRVAENTLYLPTHDENHRLGAPMNPIELKRG